jgi:hypothetical protein
MLEDICRLLHFINNISKDTFEAPQKLFKIYCITGRPNPEFQTSTYTQEGEGKVFPVHAMKAFMGSTGIAPLILNLDTVWR